MKKQTPDLGLLFQEEREHYFRLLEWTRRGLASLEEGGEGDLLQFLNGRRKILEKIAAREESFRPWIMRLREPDLSRLAPVLLEIRRLGEEILHLQGAIEIRLKDRQKLLQEKMAALHQGHRALRGYARGSRPPSRLLDRQG